MLRKECLVDRGYRYYIKFFLSKAILVGLLIWIQYMKNTKKIVFGTIEHGKKCLLDIKKYLKFITTDTFKNFFHTISLVLIKIKLCLRTHFEGHQKPLTSVF